MINETKGFINENIGVINDTICLINETNGYVNETIRLIYGWGLINNIKNIIPLA